MNDPINRPGNWNGDSSLKDVSTQSPRFLALSDGGASGGLDSRFDFILASDPILSGSKGIRYVPGSYTSYGNDGQHYNKALTDLPQNSAVSQAMAQNLYNMSDHLPVYASFAFTPLHLIPTAVVAGVRQDLSALISVQNPFSNVIKLKINADFKEPVSYKLLSLQGSIIQQGSLNTSVPTISLHHDLPEGMSFLKMFDKNGNTATYKLMHH